ncbi:crAss001_48 related protein, partial [Vibrio lentus]|uniref:crAss001_48 related protein n=2 Tax=Vibrionaceae TaxID=641 RepID=UPI00197E8918
MNLSIIKHPSLKLTDLLPFLIFIVGTGFAIGYEFVSPSPEKGLLNSALYMTFIVAIFSLCIEKDNSRCLRKRLDIEVEEHRKAVTEPVKPDHLIRMEKELDDLKTKIKKLRSFIKTNPDFNALSRQEQMLMIIQISEMTGYQSALKLRINIENGHEVS